MDPRVREDDNNLRFIEVPIGQTQAPARLFSLFGAKTRLVAGVFEFLAGDSPRSRKLVLIGFDEHHQCCVFATVTTDAATTVTGQA